MKNRLDIVEAIICKNSNLVKGTARNYGYCNPLKNAVDEGHLEIVKVLIAAGADVNAINEIGGFPPLYLAVLQGYLDIVKVLIAAGADVNAKGGGYNCPESVLHRAVIEGRLEIAQALLEADGIDVNAEGGYGGETALQRAVIGGNVDIVKALIDAGADVNAKNKEGKAALSLAASYGRYAITLFLLTGKVKGFLAKNIVPIVTFLSLVAVGLLAAYFVPQAFLILTGPLLGSLGLIHNLPVLQVTVLSLIGSLGGILVGSLVSRFDGKMDSDPQNTLGSVDIIPGTGNKAAPTAVADTGKNPSVLEKGKGNNVQASVAPSAHKQQH
jgi:hypothetical protein